MDNPNHRECFHQLMAGKPAPWIPNYELGCWTAPDGRYGVVLANWTGRPQRVTARDAHFEPGMILYTASKCTKTEPAPVHRHSMAVKLPPHSMALVATVETGN